MGRPRKEPAERRRNSLTCRLTPAERLRIERDAARAGITTSAYVREQLLSGKVIVQENRRLDYQLFDQLRRIGVNLNQLTKVANSTGKIPAEITSAARAVEGFIARELAPGDSPKNSDGPGGENGS